MTTHIKAFTYEPKIPDVRSGKCRQTIRPEGKRPVRFGDTILFHGWEGIPYRSKWSWRLRVEVKIAVPSRVWSDGIAYSVIGFYDFLPWLKVSDLAIYDGIKAINGKNEGETLGILMNKMYPTLEKYGLGPGSPFQIIRW